MAKNKRSLSFAITPKSVKLELTIVYFNEEKGKDIDLPLSFRLRPFTVRDQAWIEREIGKTEAAIGLEKLDMHIIFQIFYHMLAPTSQMDFSNAVKDFKFKKYDEESDQLVELNLKNVEKLEELVVVPDNQLKIAQALFECRGLSSEVMDALAAEVGKKKVTKIKRKAKKKKKKK